MGSASTEFSNTMLDSFLGDNKGPLMPATVYVGLFVEEPSDGGGGVECVGNGYARVPVTNDSTNWPAAVNAEKRNGTVIEFPQATGDWGDIDWVGVWDDSEDGTMLCWGSLQNTASPVAGNTPFFSIGGIILRHD